MIRQHPVLTYHRPGCLARCVGPPELAPAQRQVAEALRLAQADGRTLVVAETHPRHGTSARDTTRRPWGRRLA